MNEIADPTTSDDILTPESLLAALLRRTSLEADIEPAYSICASCGCRVDGTSKRRYCGRRCAAAALLIRRRQARSRLSQRRLG